MYNYARRVKRSSMDSLTNLFAETRSSRSPRVALQRQVQDEPGRQSLTYFNTSFTHRCEYMYISLIKLNTNIIYRRRQTQEYDVIIYCVNIAKGVLLNSCDCTEPSC